MIACAIHFSDGGPVLFRHLRIGKDGLPFTVYKFRSMVVDAEARKADLEGLNEVNGVLFKIRRDPRLTPIGGWIRHWSIDEIPQLFNVLRGEMSLVGPRPWAALPYEKAALAGDYVPTPAGRQARSHWPMAGQRAGELAMGRIGSAGSLGTSSTGLWRWTCRSCGRPHGPSRAGPARTEPGHPARGGPGRDAR